MMSKKACKFRNCKTVRKSNLRMYTFPQDEKRCKKWLEVVNNPDLNELPIEKLRNFLICELHFKDWCFMNVTTKLHLVKNAVPVIDKPAACCSDLPASNRNEESCPDLKDSSAKKLCSSSCISELHFEDLCDKYNLLDYTVPIAKETSILNKDSTASIGNTAAVRQPTANALRLEIPKLSEILQENAKCLALPVYLQKTSVTRIDPPASIHNAAVVKSQTGNIVQPKTFHLIKSQKSINFATQMKTPPASVNNIVVFNSQAGSMVQPKTPHLSETQDSRGFTQTETSLNVSEASTPKETVKRLLPVSRTYFKLNACSKQTKEDTPTSCKGAVASLHEVSKPEAQKSFTQIETPSATIHNMTVINSQTSSMVQSKIPHLYVSEACMPRETVKRPLPMSRIYSKENNSFKHSKQSLTSTSGKDDAATINIAIIKEDFPCGQLTDVDVGKIQSLILERIDCISSEGPKPCLKTFNLNDGILVYTCSDEASCLWLKETLEGKIIGSGTPLMVVDPKKVPHHVMVVFNTKDVITTDSSKLLRRLQFFNSRLQVRYWRVLERKQKKGGQKLILQVDRPSFTAIKEANFKAFTGVDEGTFAVMSIPKPVKLVNRDILKSPLSIESCTEKQSVEPH